MLTWKYEDDEYHYRDYWKAYCGPIFVGRVERDYRWSNIELLCVIELGILCTCRVKSFDEGKIWIENKFKETLIEARLIEKP